MSVQGALQYPQFSSVQSLSRVQLFATPWIAAYQASLSITSSRSLLKPMSIESVMPSSHLILCRPLLLLPSIPPSVRVFSNEVFAWGGQIIGVSASAPVFPMNTQDWSPQDGLVGSPCSPRDSQVSKPLIQLSAEGWGSAPSLSVVWPDVGLLMTSKKDLCQHWPPSATAAPLCHRLDDSNCLKKDLIWKHTWRLFHLHKILGDIFVVTCPINLKLVLKVEREKDFITDKKDLLHPLLVHLHNCRLLWTWPLPF